MVVNNFELPYLLHQICQLVHYVATEHVPPSFRTVPGLKRTVSLGLLFLPDWASACLPFVVVCVCQVKPETFRNPINALHLGMFFAPVPNFGWPLNLKRRVSKRPVVKVKGASLQKGCIAHWCILRNSGWGGRAASGAQQVLNSICAFLDEAAN